MKKSPAHEQQLESTSSWTTRNKAIHKTVSFHELPGGGCIRETQSSPQLTHSSYSSPALQGKRIPSLLMSFFGVAMVLLLCFNFLHSAPIVSRAFTMITNDSEFIHQQHLQADLGVPPLPKQSRQGHFYSGKNNNNDQTRNRTTPLRRTMLLAKKNSSSFQASSSAFFLNWPQMVVGKNSNDVYSGAWWGSTDLFISKWRSPSTMVAITASFHMFKSVAGKDHTYMTRDWLNFHVEHLSHYFKYSKVSVQMGPQNYSFDVHAQKQWQYMQKAAAGAAATSKQNQPQDDFSSQQRSTSSSFDEKATRNDPGENPFTKTIALLPYYRSLKVDYEITLDASSVPKGKARIEYLYMLSISATITSLAKNGIPRIVIAGNTQQCPLEIQYAVTLFQQATSNVWNVTTNVYSQNQNNSQRGIPSHAESPNETPSPPSYDSPRQTIEIDYVSIFGQEDREKIHTPPYALEELQKAFRGEVPKARRKEWLGKDDDNLAESAESNSAASNSTYHGRWKYLYFSEPDLILHSRLERETLAMFRQAMDTRNILAPHRFQLLTHASDFPLDATQHAEEYIPAVGRHAMAMDLYLDHDSCCDGGNYWPGKDNAIEDECTLPKVLWWRCGQDISTNHKKNKQQGKHQNKTKNEKQQQDGKNSSAAAAHKGRSSTQSKNDKNDEDETQRYTYHQRLQMYPHIRLGDGMKVTAVQEHGRLCIPQPRGTCEIA